MPEKLEQQIRRTFEQIDVAADPHRLPISSQVWSRLQFRLAYRTRGGSYALYAGTLLPALYVLGFVMWITWAAWFSTIFIALLASAVAAAGLLGLRVSRRFRT